MINERPNIFEFATKELSQDAVFMYLFDCCNSSCAEEQKIGRDFLDELYGLQEQTIRKPVSEIVIKKQYHKIDVLVLVEYEDNTKDAVILEDKTYSSEHDNQLARYYHDVKDNGVDGVTVSSVYGVYFKLGQLNESEKNALRIDEHFSYKLLPYDLFRDYLNQHKEANLVMDLIYDFYNKRLEWISKIDKADFHNPVGLVFEQVLSDGYAQDKFFTWMIKEIVGAAHYHPVNQYSVMNFGSPCTQYRFIFTSEDEASRKWDGVTKGTVSRYCYYFRVDKNTNGWYIAVNQYSPDGEKDWDAKKKCRDAIRKQIEPVAREHDNKADGRGKKESKICLFYIRSYADVQKLIPALQEIYRLVLQSAVKAALCILP